MFDDGKCSKCGTKYDCRPSTSSNVLNDGEPAYIVQRGKSKRDLSGSLIAHFCSAKCFVEWINEDSKTDDTLLY